MNKEGSKRNAKEHNEGHTVTTHGLYGMLHVGNVVLSRRLRPYGQGINLRCAAILCEGANQTLRSILVRGPQPKIVREKAVLSKVLHLRIVVSEDRCCGA